MDLSSQDQTTQQQQKRNGRRVVGSSQIWTRYGVLLPSQQTRKLKEWVLTDEQQQLVSASGLGHLALTTGFTIDRSLLTAFCERWDNETNTAHFMGFEMAPSLRDVSYILGIPVTGHVVTAEPIGDEAVKRMCCHYLGESPGSGEQLCGLIRLTWLYRKFHQLPENPTINDIVFSTRAYLLYLVGSTLFPDTMRGFVSPRYLPLLGDFGKIHEYAWGAAALAHLYRGLSVAVTPNSTTQFLGSATLLMAWIYEYFPLTQPQQKNQNTLLPRACRWNFGGVTRGQRKNVMEWGKVNWNPYKDINPAIVPGYCIAADNVCYSRTWLISFNIKEVYVPDRFTRQFGREQGRLHGVPMWARRTWSKGKDWRIEYAREIEDFHQLVGCHFTPSAETNINSLPNWSIAGQSTTGCSRNAPQNFSVMVEDLKNDLPVIDRYLEGQLLPVEVASFLERVSTMIKTYSPPQSSQRKEQAAQGQNRTVSAKNPRKRVKPLIAQDPSSPQDSLLYQNPGVLVPNQATKSNRVLDGTVPLLNGEVFKEHEAMDPWQMSHLAAESSSSPDSSSQESRKRRQCPDEARTPRSNEVLRRSGRLCVQLKMFKHKDGVGAEETNPIFL
ncbi:protein MAIN-LIKE 1 isoform X2 [Brachypodium distachyon]|uniref:protein MAIN-LIKE 1 isoform X2 n=1 Tax=Brachypodium distachyon TaxID=15368 RepID=UPI00052FF946|nr:protein MAIN-LIKE 1 isoform X2 [Brachypodium distachyon]|eukprot:XP_010237918.1 protein MAIN-LIKE 1 isoform X2 [Brachypodium distachyon]